MNLAQCQLISEPTQHVMELILSFKYLHSYHGLAVNL